MYRQVFSKGTQQVLVKFPSSWSNDDVEVSAYPVSERPMNRDGWTRPSPEVVEERRRQREELHRNYSVSFKEMGIKFNRNEANDYD